MDFVCDTVNQALYIEQVQQRKSKQHSFKNTSCKIFRHAFLRMSPQDKKPLLIITLLQEMPFSSPMQKNQIS